jgi:hypothetical protein
MVPVPVCSSADIAGDVLSFRAQRNAQIGLALFVIGFLGQLIGTWLW